MTLDSFSLAGRVAVVTGGYGVIGGCITALAESKARVVIRICRDAAEAKAQEIRQQGGDDWPPRRRARRASGCAPSRRDSRVVRTGRHLFNGAGGNRGRARNDTKPIFDVPRRIR